MLTTLVFLAASAFAACPVSFEFNGQPECVQLSYQDGQTSVINECADPILVDESVRLDANHPSPSGIVAPHSQAVIRDLSAFTLGMNGQIYGVVASIASAPDACDEIDDLRAAPRDDRVAAGSEHTGMPGQDPVPTRH